MNTSEKIELDEREFLRLGFLGCPLEATWDEALDFIWINTGLKTEILKIDYPLPCWSIQVRDWTNELLEEIQIPEGTFPEEDMKRIALISALDCLQWDD